MHCDARRWTGLAILLSGLWLAFEAAAFAGDARLTHLGHLMADEAAGENAPELPLDFGLGIRLAGTAIELEKTRLEDIQSRFGGALHSHGAASGETTWLCYTASPAPQAKRSTIWLIATSVASGVASHPLGILAIQQVDAGATDGCAPLPKNAGGLMLGVPALGATPAQLKAQFGQLPYDKLRNIYYDSARSASGMPGKSVYQRLAYVVAKGVVVGVAIAQTTN